MRRPDGELWTLQAFTEGAETTAVWSIIQYYDVPADLRIEPEYYQPRYLKLQGVLEELESCSLESLAHTVNSGPFGSNLLKTTYVDDGVVVLRPFNIKDATVENENLVFIPLADCEAQGLNLYASGDLAFARVGDMRCGVIPDFGKPITISPNIIVAKLDRDKINPYYAAVFMNTKLGFSQLQRALKVVAQPTVTVETIKSLTIPIILKVQQLEIERLLKASFQERLHSQTLYTQAETLLMTELGLDTLDLTPQRTYVQTSSQAWSANRLDAEYFQPKYDSLLSKIQGTGEAVRLGDWLTEPIRRGIQPEYVEDGEITVINSQHVGKTHIELEDNRRATRQFISQNERAVVQIHDVLLNSTGYITIGRCQTLLDDVAAMVDGHVAIIRPKPGLDPIYLGLFLNSFPGQMQTERNWTGSSGQIELRSELVENYVVWKPKMTFQNQIHQLVEGAHRARQEAARLLEEAKTRVEMWIMGKNTND